MELHYELTEKDYLNFQLYHTSMDKAVKKQRRNTQFIVAGVTAVMGSLCLIGGNLYAGVVLLLCSVPVYFLCAFYASLLYRFSLRNHVAVIYRRSTPREVSVYIRDNGEIEYHERGLVKKTPFSELESISDVDAYIYLKLGEASYIIIPKQALSDPAYVEDRLRQNADKFNIPFTYDPSWKWS